VLRAEIEQSINQTFYRSLYRIRRVEEEIAKIYPSDKIKSPIHLSIGQEAVSVGVCEALLPEDIVFGTYRGHALYLAKGGDLKKMIAELYGKATGCAKGKGGSMHLIDVDAGVMGTSAVVGTTIPLAVGYAYALKQQGKKAVVASFFGDGAVEEGVFHESLNFAALKRLPIIFICENNLYAIHTHQRQRQPLANICDRARIYGIPAERIENNDVLVLHEQVSAAVKSLRNGESGPFFFECMTYRWKEHVGPSEDFHLGYRLEQEAQPWIENDPVRRLATKVAQERRSQIEAEVEAEIQQAFEFAEHSPFPDAPELFTDVFKDVPDRTIAATAPEKSSFPVLSDRTLPYTEAIREATDQEMARDASVIVFGLDVDDPKAILGTTKGLVEKYGSDRVFGTPLSEDAMTGAAIGMSLAGLRPVHIHIRMDFLLLAMNQLVNMAAKSHYMYGGQVHVPLVVRSTIGKSWGQGAQHSQALYSYLMHVPGLKVVAPTTPYDAKGCLIAAIRDENPVMYVDHRLLHFQKGPVPELPYTVVPGKCRITSIGNDITLVGISFMQIECLRARGYLEEVGVHAEVIDPIWLIPLDIDTIVESVRKTGRLCVVDNGWMTCGASAEIIAQVTERLQGVRDVRVRRLGFAPVTCPTTPSLETLFYPNGRTIAAAAYDLVQETTTGWFPEERSDLKDIEFKGPF
jgi:pyruvate/2-oxoglutarate/acetoin dehydrogenase E1 component/TPP-dependent pyruvate/acetoin dehydrogenase alpha subunit